MKYTKALESTAYHEAGHAVAAWHFRVRGKSLSIIPDGSSLGRFSHAPYFGGLRPGLDDSPRCQRRLENMALVCLAAPAAQRKFYPRGYRRYHARGDYSEARNLLSYISRGNTELDAHIALIEIRARNFVQSDKMWAAIEELAVALLDQREISGKGIKPIILRGYRRVGEAVYGKFPKFPDDDGGGPGVRLRDKFEG